MSTTCAIPNTIVRTREQVFQINLSKTHHESVIALAGNPNTGKSTIFNALTGLNQHTGNWPGKTVKRMEGKFRFHDRHYRLIDLPGTYSLLSTSTDEEIARNFVLFGKPDVTVVVVDSTCLERNLNLVLQIAQITNNVILCCNLIDEAKRKSISVDQKSLEQDLGIPVVLTSARSGDGLDELKQKIEALVTGQIRPQPFAVSYPHALKEPVEKMTSGLRELFPTLPNPAWVAMRLLDGDEKIKEALASPELLPALLNNDSNNSSEKHSLPSNPSINKIFNMADQLSQSVRPVMHDLFVESLFEDAQRITRRAVVKKNGIRIWDNSLDRFFDIAGFWHTGYANFAVRCFFLTIEGANIPSQILADWLFLVEDLLDQTFHYLNAPWWLTGFFVHGVYRGLAWVISVMLPPMAIFFPIFTFLEDFGYLPRVAFNLDRLFKWSGAHGKQALAMGMGFGCNAAGVIATRIIDSPRERLIAIITNNFVPCNGRWPTLIMLASLFVAAAFPSALSSVAAASTVVFITLFGVLVTLLVSKFLSTRTSLRGESSFFQIELPPYRRPQFLRIIYTSLIDRTLLVLWRAIVMAAPAGGLCWLLANIYVGQYSLFAHAANFLQPLGQAIGLDGVILLAYIIAIPANEIIVPTIIMGYMAAGQMTELDSDFELKQLFIQNGWSVMTAVSLMLFSLLHYPCSTTTMTIWKETRSVKWTVVSNLLPLSIAFAVCFMVAQTWPLLFLIINS